MDACQSDQGRALAPVKPQLMGGGGATNLKRLFDVLHESIELSSAEEIKTACALIIEVQAMDSAERDCLRAAFRNGPLQDGEVPSKAGRNRLLDKGIMSKVVVKGDDGYNACTYKGLWAYRLLEAGA